MTFTRPVRFTPSFRIRPDKQSNKVVFPEPLPPKIAVKAPLGATRLIRLRIAECSGGVCAFSLDAPRDLVIPCIQDLEGLILIPISSATRCTSVPSSVQEEVPLELDPVSVSMPPVKGGVVLHEGRLGTLRTW